MAEPAPATPVNSRPVIESRFAAEVRRMSLQDFGLVHQDLSRRELERRLAAGEDPLELALKVARLAYALGHFEGYGEGRTHAWHEAVMEQIQQRRAER